MSDSIRISVDAMGGDKGPRVVFHGARLALRERRNIKFIFHGREDELRPLLDDYPELKPVSRIAHSANVIAMDDKPSNALRKGRGNSSMWAALESVRDGEADVAISGGNTGALMAMATFCLRPMEGISRPAHAPHMPPHRRHLADPAHRHHRARRRRNRRRRCPPTGRFLDPRRRSGARPVRPGGPNGWPPQHRHRRAQGSR